MAFVYYTVAFLYHKFEFGMGWMQSVGCIFNTLAYCYQSLLLFYCPHHIVRSPNFYDLTSTTMHGKVKLLIRFSNKLAWIQNCVCFVSICISIHGNQPF